MHYHHFLRREIKSQATGAKKTSQVPKEEGKSHGSRRALSRLVRKVQNLVRTKICPSAPQHVHMPGGKEEPG